MSELITIAEEVGAYVLLEFRVLICARPLMMQLYGPLILMLYFLFKVGWLILRHRLCLEFGH